MYLNTLRPRDLLIGITQSGETKDLVDIFQDVRTRVPGLRRISLVNNENSRIPQELSEFYLPILCGPEIAVAATKSFLNQIAILYLLAASFSLTERKIVEKLHPGQGPHRADPPGLRERRGGGGPSGCTWSLPCTSWAPGSSAWPGRAPSRSARWCSTTRKATTPPSSSTAPTRSWARTPSSPSRTWRACWRSTRPSGATRPSPGGLEALKAWPELVETRFSNYPLVFVCPSDERDVRITISQIHTHKIRGADILLIAEKNPDLALAVAGRPMGQDRYWSKYLEVPSTGDPNLFVFAATVLLQRLAFRMSVLKMEYMDQLKVVDHGVHPDSPKNVSKSITVD